MLLATSLLTSYGYLSEQFTAWYGGAVPDHYQYAMRLYGFRWFTVVVWTLFFCNTVAPQVLWVKSWRRRPWVLFVVSVIVLVGM